jgi:hypothetical protein
MLLQHPQLQLQPLLPAQHLAMLQCTSKVSAMGMVHACNPLHQLCTV